MIDMANGQRLLVKSLVEAKNGRRVVHIGQKVHIIKKVSNWPDTPLSLAGAYDLGKDNSGNFGTVIRNAVEGVHFEIIPGEVPFPEKTTHAPMDFSVLLGGGKR